MSLYNMIFGFNPACIAFMPMLGRKQDDYPRFRDCFLSDDDQHIVIYTRVGGPNREGGYGEEVLLNDPLFVKTWDDESDNTYGYYMFNVPEKWKKDFDLLVQQKLAEVSDEYVKYVEEFYPKLAAEGIIRKFFLRPEGWGKDDKETMEAAEEV